MTGRTVRIIHSGRLPERRKASTTFSRVVAFLRFCLRLGGAHLLPELLRQLVQIQAAEDVVKGLGAHIGAEDLAPAMLELAVAALADEGEGAQLHAARRAGGEDWFTEAEVWSSSWLRRASICRSASALIAPACILMVFQILGELVLQLVFKSFQLLLDDLLYLADVLGGDLVVGIEDLLAGQLETTRSSWPAAPSDPAESSRASGLP